MQNKKKSKPDFLLKCVRTIKGLNFDDLIITVTINFSPVSFIVLINGKLLLLSQLYLINIYFLYLGPCFYVYNCVT